MKKKVSIFMTMIFGALFSLGGCAEKESFEAKPLTGIDAIFNDSLGYNAENPSVMQTDDYTRYVYYTSNAEKYGEVADTVCVRKGVLRDGTWKYSEKKTVLETSDNGWDSKHVYAPSVIKGDFTYKGRLYRYLLAYSGNKSSVSAINSQIGLAVSNEPDGGFIKIGERPIVSYDVFDWDVTGLSAVKGASEPSLISYNGSDKVWLFYSFYSPVVASTERVLELDLSKDLSELPQYDVLEGFMLNTGGISDSSEAPNLLGADFAYDEYSESLYAVRDCYEIAITAPLTAEAVQVVKANVDDAVYEIPTHENELKVWREIGDRINNFNTAVHGDENRFGGYDRIYSAAIVRDSFGRMISDESVEIVFTSCAVPETTDKYEHSAQLHSFTLTAGGET